MRSIFLPYEVEAVLSIPISPINLRDSQVWAKTANGIFSVKGAYKVAVKYLLDTNGGDASLGCSDNSKMAAIWKMIWNLRCLNKIKYFMWRACKNVFPTKQCLMHRKVLLEDRCDLCEKVNLQATSCRGVTLQGKPGMKQVPSLTVQANLQRSSLMLSGC